MTEHGIAVDHSRRSIAGCSRFAPEDGEAPALAVAPDALGEFARRRDLRQGPRTKWVYLYRAVDKFGDTIDAARLGVLVSPGTARTRALSTRPNQPYQRNILEPKTDYPSTVSA